MIKHKHQIRSVYSWATEFYQERWIYDFLLEGVSIPPSLSNDSPEFHYPETVDLARCRKQSSKRFKREIMRMGKLWQN